MFLVVPGTPAKLPWPQGLPAPSAEERAAGVVVRVVGAIALNLPLAHACAAVALGAMLAGCAPAGRVKDHLVLAFAGCAETPLENIDWSAARTVDIRIRQDEFQPMVVGLTRDIPYVLHIRNADSSTRGFRSPTFFRKAAVAEIVVDGEARDLDGGCITGVSVPANGAVEVRLVALLEGRYDFEDPSWLRLGFYEEGNGFGTILVE
jgi:hypothetical protein